MVKKIKNYILRKFYYIKFLYLRHIIKKQNKKRIQIENEIFFHRYITNMKCEKLPTKKEMQEIMKKIERKLSIYRPISEGKKLPTEKKEMCEITKEIKKKLFGEG